MNVYRPTTLEEFSHIISSHVAPIFAFEGKYNLVAGTAVLIAPHFALTAKHVMDYILKEFNINIEKQKDVSLDIYICQASLGCVWYVSQIFSWVGTDIVLLRLHPRNDKAESFEIKRLPMTVAPPTEGSEITALGYPGTKMEIRRNDLEVTEIKLMITPTVSTGRVLQIHRSLRDSKMLNFPCFSVDAKFTSGMSGGAVFNDEKELCGLVSSGTEGDMEELISYSNAASIWPIMITKLYLNPGGLSPPGLEIGREYRILDLARMGYLDFRGHERIEFFKHENGSDGVRR